MRVNSCAELCLWKQAHENPGADIQVPSSTQRTCEAAKGAPTRREKTLHSAHSYSTTDESCTAWGRDIIFSFSHGDKFIFSEETPANYKDEECEGCCNCSSSRQSFLPCSRCNHSLIVSSYNLLFLISSLITSF